MNVVVQIWQNGRNHHKSITTVVWDCLATSCSILQTFFSTAFDNRPTLDAPWHSNQTFSSITCFFLREKLFHQHFHPWKFDRNLHFSGQLSLLFCAYDHLTFAIPKISSRPDASFRLILLFCRANLAPKPDTLGDTINTHLPTHWCQFWPDFIFAQILPTPHQISGGAQLFFLSLVFPRNTNGKDNPRENTSKRSLFLPKSSV